MQKVTNLKEAYVSGNYSDQGKAFWITDSGRSYCYGYDSRNSMLHPQAGTNWTVKMVITILSIGTHLLALIKMCTSLQMTKVLLNMQVVIDLQMRYGKIYHWGRNNWLTGHNWWTHGWSSTNGQGYNQGHGR